jgi:beta-1,2-mannobiose phosphorylase / 1,2-beta-oligomannan phosphorylase
MIEVQKHGVLLRKTELGFENEGVLNPAVIRYGGHIHMFYRAVSKGNYSSIGYCNFTSPLVLDQRFEHPILFPQDEIESHGIEDPRISMIDDVFYLSFTAFDGVNALACLATSTDLEHFERKGLISPIMTWDKFCHLASAKSPLNEKYHRFNSHEGIREKEGKKVFIWDKNTVFFPRRINGKITFLHRIKPDIQIVAIDHTEDLTHEFWRNYFLHHQDHVVMSPRFKHEVSYIGGGCPPIETDKGWLLIYHGVYDSVNGYVYSACAALLDLENPAIELSRLPYPLFKPDHEWELLGEVNNVCFPTGTILEGETLYIYYGAADEQIACASVNINQLLTELIHYLPNHAKS